jgi:hypothetical protein
MITLCGSAAFAPAARPVAIPNTISRNIPRAFHHSKV